MLSRTLATHHRPHPIRSITSPFCFIPQPLPLQRGSHMCTTPKGNNLNIVMVMWRFHDVLRTFAALPILLWISPIKWGLRWKRSWNSGQNFEFGVFSFKCFLFETHKYYFALNSRFVFELFAKVDIHKVVSTLVKVVNFDVENGNVVSTMSSFVNIKVKTDNVLSTLFNVVNFSVDVHNVVLTLIWRCPRSWRYTNLAATFRQR